MPRWIVMLFGRHILPHPKLQPLDLIFAHHHNIFFRCSGHVQKVTDSNNQHNKEPHWQHNFWFTLYKPKTIPVSVYLKKKCSTAEIVEFFGLLIEILLHVLLFSCTNCGWMYSSSPWACLQVTTAALQSCDGQYIVVLTNHAWWTIEMPCDSHVF